MMSLCLAPVLLLGSLMTSQVTTHVSPETKRSTGSGVLAEVMTCDTGLGLDAKASTNGLYAVDLQYGLKLTRGNFSLAFIPKGGVSYADHEVKELPQQTQFSVGAQLLGSYKDFNVGVELWHLSNAGMTDRNVGLNMIALQTGWRF